MFLTIVEKDFILHCYKGIVCKMLMLGLWFWVGKKKSWLVIMSKTDIGKRTMKGAFIPFKLMWDVTYPMHPWFYSPFKGKNNGLSWKKLHWNFTKCSSQMAIESAKFFKFFCQNLLHHQIQGIQGRFFKIIQFKSSNLYIEC